MPDSTQSICLEPRQLQEIRRLAQLARIADTPADQARYALEIENTVNRWLGSNDF